MQHALILEDQRHYVALSRAAEGYRLHLDGRQWPCSISREGDGSHVITVGGSSERIRIAQRADDIYLHYRGRAYHLRYRHPLDLLAEKQGGAAADGLRAPMPGSLIALHTAPGAEVAKGQTLLVIESMKMETTILAPRDGVVEAIHVSAGDTFNHDALLLSLVPNPSSQEAQP